jgi:hypothetical protein
MQFKDTMISKMTGPAARSATSLGKEVGVTQSTLSRWLRERGSVGCTGRAQMGEGKGRSWSAEQKLEALLEYERLSEEEHGKFLWAKSSREIMERVRKATRN